MNNTESPVCEVMTAAHIEYQSYTKLPTMARVSEIWAPRHEEALDTNTNGQRNQHNIPSKLPFLLKLHTILDEVEKTGDEDIISWQKNGRSFKVHKPKEFVRTIIPKYFNQTKYKSFQRQLHLYNFQRIRKGPEAGSYSHPKFVRGFKALSMTIHPKKGNHKNSTVDQGKLPVTAIVFEEEKTSVPINRSKWAQKVKQFLVSGSALAAELEKESKESNTILQDGDKVYAFGGMPFRFTTNYKSDIETFDSDFGLEELKL